MSFLIELGKKPLPKKKQGIIMGIKKIGPIRGVGVMSDNIDNMKVPEPVAPETPQLMDVTDTLFQDKIDDDADITGVTSQAIRDEEENIQTEPANVSPAIVAPTIIDKTNTGYNRQSLLTKLRERRLVLPTSSQSTIPIKTTQPTGATTQIYTPSIIKDKIKDTVTKKGKILIRKPRTKTNVAIAPPSLSIDVDEDSNTTTTGIKPIRKIRRRLPTKFKIVPKIQGSTIVTEAPESMLIFQNDLENRIQRKPLDEIKASSYYLNNRETFINFINTLFMPYRDEIMRDDAEISCDKGSSGDFDAFTHQKIVRDYLNVFSPYRGLLLYHGLGSGKTCTSIGIAEGLKHDKKVMIMTPASLQMNYREQLKQCGDLIYKKNQYWEFVPLSTIEPEHMSILTEKMNISTIFIRAQKGVWLIDVTKKSNYDSLTAIEKEDLNKQINHMIQLKYEFLNYNGLRSSHLEKLTRNFTINPFSNKVIIIDEAHNFISRIVNKLKRETSLAMRLYNYLLEAEDCRIVMLTGTPIINYPNEIGVLFNILRGYIKSWELPLNIRTDRKINEATLRDIFERVGILDYIQYKPSTKSLVITRNPFGFINAKSKKDGSYKGVKTSHGDSDQSQLTDAEFIALIISRLKNENIEVVNREVRPTLFKALPDKLDDFKQLFINENGEVMNDNMFKRRILGLTSYFRSAREELMPRYNEHEDFKEIKIPMSDYQFDIYEKARHAERKQEKKTTKKPAGDDLYDDTVSTYRIFSRAFCNFVFPPELKRPMPKDEDDIEDAILNKLDETDIEDKGTNILPNMSMVAPITQAITITPGDVAEVLHSDDEDDIKEKSKENKIDISYDDRIKDALLFLKENSSIYLSPEGLETYSPKFLRILENITTTLGHDGIDGSHLIYTQFRTLEGIGILKLVLEANGFVEFKLKKRDSKWYIDIPEEEMGKPTFALYTGKETSEEKELVRNIFNSNWDYVPSSITNQLRLISPNNHYGDVVKILMITASGAEGIDLKNIRYVHLMEPYWHPVRLEQVIGRAIRICSHKDLPEELRNVKVYLYLMTLTDKQKSGEMSRELIRKDISRIDNTTPVTSDETLNEISRIKQDINKQLLTSIKEAAIDCAVHSTTSSKEGLICYSFGETNPERYAYTPSYKNQEKDKESRLNKETIKWKAINFKLGGKKYMLRLNSDGSKSSKVYDYDSFEQAKLNPAIKPLYVGKLVITGKVARIIRE